ncbi:uncharacterized protein LOC115384076 [Salarias fasciatus]|uniref:uncharacterized protein LOC115384076 n=1 Tax=Salarias fasciatus TaxID=181472 RepID=UPI00117679CB|nr:uncharacterized protein LOC115384076 [Salarias fasciatus]
MEAVQHEEEEEEAEHQEGGGAMLWSLQEALDRQTLQIGVSACGATAVLDVLKLLGVAVSAEEAEFCVQTRLRRNDASLDDYLLSRSEAGATHAQLISGAEEASGGKVTGRFFHLHPPRRVRLMRWLERWIRAGAVPVATMNMQAGVADGEELPDAWHHQLVFGVCGDAAFMTNPLDVVLEAELQPRLCSESELLIRRDDVLSRIPPDCSVTELMEKLENLEDPRWRELHVKAQVLSLVQQQQDGDQRTSHLRIPAAYQSGVSLFAVRGTQVCRDLMEAQELQIL